MPNATDANLAPNLTRVKHPRPEHSPTGAICACGLRADQHRQRARKKRPEHAPTGDPCACGLRASEHRGRTDRPHGAPREAYIVGLDGEGLGRAPHLYTYMAARGEDGRTWDASNAEGLSTLQCLELILTIPGEALIVGFALGYDHTKWLKDLPDRDLYRLMHEETRVRLIKGKRVYRPIRYEGYRIGYMNGRLTVRKGAQQRIVWDIFRFYQCAFTTALQQWGIATKADLASMQRMKDTRGSFTAAGWEGVKGYCREECLMLCRLMRALLTAHSDAGLKLKDYYGAGSSSSAMLRVMGIKSQIQAAPAAMRHAVRCGFFGGRFENSVVGPVPVPVYSYDISSAYPYQTSQLPCLRHGKWKFFKGAISTAGIAGADAALVNWELPLVNGTRLRHWAPWPVRKADGGIIYPAAALGGWAWRDEYLAGIKLAPWAIMQGAWLYATGCECRPFAGIVEYYRERLKLGKDGKGLAIKLAINGCYGKLAQTKGQAPPFQSFVWAGIITSHTRAQLLEAILAAHNPSSVLMVATDGVFSTEPLTLPRPLDTDTGQTGKPLGGWEAKEHPEGVFIARPGIYWPLGTDEVKDIKARGVGKALVRDKRPEIMAALESGAPEIEIQGLQRFIGIRDAVTFAPKKGEYKRSPAYGEWVEQSQRVTFGAEPKRACVRHGRLLLHGYYGEESAPYSKLLEQKGLESGALMLEET